MGKYTVYINHGKGVTGKYRVEAQDKTEARKVCPWKNKISKIELGWE